MKRGSARRRSVRWSACLLLGVALTTWAVSALCTAGVPLGQVDKLLYRHSGLMSIRLERCWPVVLICWLMGFALRLIRNGNRGGVASFFVAVGMLCAWQWWALPGNSEQHAMNMVSPAQDGAFLNEATEMREMTAGEYLRGFDQRIRTHSVTEMRSSRVLSNPPGMVLLGTFILREFPSDVGRPGVFERFLLASDTRPEDIPTIAEGLKFSVLLSVLWFLSSAPAYGLGRQFLSPMGAGVFTALVMFSPAALHFAPGKDVAQLLTINAMLFLFFAGIRKGRWMLTFGAGAALMLGMSFGLIHFWVALAAVVGVVLHRVFSRGSLRDLPGHLMAAAAGAAMFVGAVYLVLGWNVPATLLAVARRFAEIQPEFGFTRSLWLLIGAPLFIMFLSPAVIALPLLRRRFFGWGREGFDLLAATVGVMVVVYFVGIAYELPRLWIAFTPLLTLGALADFPAAKTRDVSRAYRPLLVLVIVSLLAGAAHWAQLDVRESEYRLTGEKRFFL